jgi:hypothetical protein
MWKENLYTRKHSGKCLYFGMELVAINVEIKLINVLLWKENLDTKKHSWKCLYFRTELVAINVEIKLINVLLWKENLDTKTQLEMLIFWNGVSSN